MSTALTIMAIAATVISPLLAIQTQKFIERYYQKKSLKIDIFKQLMATRSQNAGLSSEHVRALNMIDLAFYGKIKRGKAKRSSSESNVLSSWKLYFSHLNTTYPDDDNTLRCHMEPNKQQSFPGLAIRDSERYWL